MSIQIKGAHVDSPKFQRAPHACPFGCAEPNAHADGMRAVCPPSAEVTAPFIKRLRQGKLFKM